MPVESNDRYNAFIVATSISIDFYNLDPNKVRELADVINQMNLNQ